MREGHNLRIRRRMLRSGTSTRTTRRPRDHAGFGSPTRAVAEEDRSPMRMTGKGCRIKQKDASTVEASSVWLRNARHERKRLRTRPTRTTRAVRRVNKKAHLQKASRKEKARDHLDLMMRPSRSRWLWRMPRSRSRSIRLRPTLHRLLRVRRLLALVAWRPSWEMSRHCWGPLRWSQRSMPWSRGLVKSLWGWCALGQWRCGATHCLRRPYDGEECRRRWALRNFVNLKSSTPFSLMNKQFNRSSPWDSLLKLVWKSIGTGMDASSVIHFEENSRCLSRPTVRTWSITRAWSWWRRLKRHKGGRWQD